jgi:hypothetical protein
MTFEIKDTEGTIVETAEFDTQADASAYAGAEYGEGITASPVGGQSSLTTATKGPDMTVPTEGAMLGKRQDLPATEQARNEYYQDWKTEARRTLQALYGGSYSKLAENVRNPNLKPVFPEYNSPSQHMYRMASALETTSTPAELEAAIAQMESEGNKILPTVMSQVNKKLWRRDYNQEPVKPITTVAPVTDRKDASAPQGSAIKLLGGEAQVAINADQDISEWRKQDAGANTMTTLFPNLSLRNKDPEAGWFAKSMGTIQDVGTIPTRAITAAMTQGFSPLAGDMTFAEEMGRPDAYSNPGERVFDFTASSLVPGALLNKGAKVIGSMPAVVNKLPKTSLFLRNAEELTPAIYEPFASPAPAKIASAGQLAKDAIARGAYEGGLYSIFPSSFLATEPERAAPGAKTESAAGMVAGIILGGALGGARSLLYNKTMPSLGLRQQPLTPFGEEISSRYGSFDRLRDAGMGLAPTDSREGVQLFQNVIRPAVQDITSNIGARRDAASSVFSGIQPDIELSMKPDTWLGSVSPEITSATDNLLNSPRLALRTAAAEGETPSVLLENSAKGLTPNTIRLNLRTSPQGVPVSTDLPIEPSLFAKGGNEVDRTMTQGLEVAPNIKAPSASLSESEGTFQRIYRPDARFGFDQMNINVKKPFSKERVKDSMRLLADETPSPTGEINPTGKNYTDLTGFDEQRFYREGLDYAIKAIDRMQKTNDPQALYDVMSHIRTSMEGSISAEKRRGLSALREDLREVVNKEANFAQETATSGSYVQDSKEALRESMASANYDRAVARGREKGMNKDQAIEYAEQQMLKGDFPYQPTAEELNSAFMSTGLAKQATDVEKAVKDIPKIFSDFKKIYDIEDLFPVEGKEGQFLINTGGARLNVATKADLLQKQVDNLDNLVAMLNHPETGVERSLYAKYLHKGKGAFKPEWTRKDVDFITGAVQRAVNMKNPGKGDGVLDKAIDVAPFRNAFALFLRDYLKPVITAPIKSVARGTGEAATGYRTASEDNALFPRIRGEKPIVFNQPALQPYVEAPVFLRGIR